MCGLIKEPSDVLELKQILQDTYKQQVGENNITNEKTMKKSSKKKKNEDEEEARYYSVLTNREGWGNRAVESLLLQLESVKANPLPPHRLLYALGM